MPQNYATTNFKIPVESSSYQEDSNYVISKMAQILSNKIAIGENKIILNTNLKLGLPLENINKIAGPMMEAWAQETFSIINQDMQNQYNLVNVEVGARLAVSDIILQFSKNNTVVTGNIDVKATSEDIKGSGKSPNITSFARIRSEYIKDPDFIFIVLSLKHKTYSLKNADTGLMDGIMEVAKFNVYDLKFISASDISYNPSLGTGQIQIRDIHYVTYEMRTTWEFLQLLDKKYLKSSRRDFQQWLNLARQNQWIKE
ncbi:hypothetical protein Hs30E_09040 [Lactococcus hodotermopsidis]|uniref:Restriction endonuclease n=1 Tax=Pseudolactococcus hodotermopsidis TaxID=2709157 RepID=A0A6A0BCC2_9LACT|nr:restriction endonuclease [Lactococcus hodotermopsidis]GFH42353.1 hypothetical protein Hs30E_09040 [Lactococcus hodotermopsidis]